MLKAGPFYVVLRFALHVPMCHEISMILHTAPGIPFSSYEMFSHFSLPLKHRILMIAAGYPKKSCYANPGCYVGAVAAEMVRSHPGIWKTRKICTHLHQMSDAFFI